MKAILGNLAVALLFVTGAACSSDSPGVVHDEATSAAASTPAGAPTDPLEGTWETSPLSPEDFVGAFEAAGGSEREGKAFFAQLGNGTTTSAVITIKLQAGSFVEFETGDGVAIQGDDATYELLGDGSIRLTNGVCVSTYTYQVQGDQLRMRLQEQCAGDSKTPYGTTLYASFPFTRVS